MRYRLTLRLCFVALLALLPITRAYLSVRAEATIGTLVLVLAAGAWLATWRAERAIRRRVAMLPLEEQIAALEADPVVRDAAAGDVFGNERRDRLWSSARIAGPLLGLFYVPLLYWLSLTPAEKPDGRILLALLVPGFVIWRLWAVHYVRHYRCPSCARTLPAISLRPIRYVCGACATTWRL